MFLLTRVFAFPYLVLVIGDAMIKSVDWQVWFHQRGIEYSASFYVLASSVTFVIYLTMLTWLAVLIGLRVKKQITALFVALAAILAWAIVPIALIIGCFELTGISERDPEAVMLLASPLSFLLLNEFYELRVLGQPAWLLFVLNCTLYGTITWLLRRYCLTHLDSLLARNDRRLGTV